MSSTLTASAQDFEALGIVPAQGVHFIFTPFRIDPTGVLSTESWPAYTDQSGAFSTKLPDASAVAAVRIISSLSGWKTIWVTGYPADITLVELLTATNPDGSAKYITNPESISPNTPLPPSLQQALARAEAAAVSAQADATQTAQDLLAVIEARDEVLAAAEAVSGLLITATVAPDDDDVLIITYPAFMTDPDDPLVLVIPLGA